MDLRASPPAGVCPKCPPQATEGASPPSTLAPSAGGCTPAKHRGRQHTQPLLRLFWGKTRQKLVSCEAETHDVNIRLIYMPAGTELC